MAPTRWLLLICLAGAAGGVCLVNTGAGTPFISSLKLRLLHRTLYPQATTAQGLVLSSRLNFGPTSENNVISCYVAELRLPYRTTTVAMFAQLQLPSQLP
ncbi:hypothetical protein TRIUR3_26141 [Triticum urartu]|uniref:Malectin-like domain-containing protein n=1 Tax=Triticum urartu TaxID=4572 RepID=M7ZXQ0_TRIUA|nr:hypothetical protein TRIUR3_26141 [Triticum urartu]